MSARHLLQLRIRTEGVDENPPEPDRVPPTIGASGSLFIHAAITLLAIWPFASILTQAPNATEPAEKPAAERHIEVVTVTPEALVKNDDANNGLPPNLGLTLDDNTPHDDAFDYKIGKI